MQAASCKHATPPQEYAFGFRGRMDERYDMVRSVLGKRHIYIRNYMPHKPYGQHVNHMFITPTTQVWKQLYDGKLNAAQSHWNTKPAEDSRSPCRPGRGQQFSCRQEPKKAQGRT